MLDINPAKQGVENPQRRRTEKARALATLDQLQPGTHGHLARDGRELIC